MEKKYLASMTRVVGCDYVQTWWQSGYDYVQTKWQSGVSGNRAVMKYTITVTCSIVLILIFLSYSAFNVKTKDLLKERIKQDDRTLSQVDAKSCNKICQSLSLKTENRKTVDVRYEADDSVYQRESKTMRTSLSETKTVSASQSKSKMMNQSLTKTVSESRFSIQRILPEKQILSVSTMSEAFSFSSLLSEKFSSNDSKNATCRQEKRQKLLDEACKYVNHDPDPKLLSLIIVDDAHKLLYCEIPKVACTSWKTFLMFLSGKVESKDIPNMSILAHDTRYYPKVGLKYLFTLNKTEQEYRLNNYFKFMVVRNPFARLVSAYENKFLPRNIYTEWVHREVGTYIIRNYRTNPSEESLQTGSDVTFEELVKFLVNKSEGSRQRLDGHWWLSYDACLPCHHRYDYIAKLETLERDLDYLLPKIVPKNSTIDRSQFPHRNTNKKNNDRTKVMKYLQSLPYNLRSRLDELYDVDSAVFGYSFEENNLECKI